MVKIYSSKFQSVIDQIDKLSKGGVNKDRVLIVLDIDNALLKAENAVGSDQWFDWQLDMIKNDKNNKYKVSETKGKLVDLFAKMAQKQTLCKCEKDQDKLVNKLVSDGYNIVYVTSRGSEVVDITLQEMKRNNYKLTNSFDSHNYLYKYPFLTKDQNIPFNKLNDIYKCPNSSLEQYNFTNEEIQKYKLYRSKLTCLKDSIFFTSGQHKGALVKILLDKSNQQYDYIVVFDDKEPHVDGFMDVFKEKVIGIVYTGQKDAVENFNKLDKDIIAKQFKELFITL